MHSRSCSYETRCRLRAIAPVFPLHPAVILPKWCAVFLSFCFPLSPFFERDFRLKKRSKCPYSIIWHCGLAIGDDVFHVLTRTQFDPTSEQLLRGNRSYTCFLIVARPSRDSLAHDEILDLHISTR